MNSKNKVIDKLGSELINRLYMNKIKEVYNISDYEIGILKPIFCIEVMELIEIFIVKVNKSRSLNSLEIELLDDTIIYFYKDKIYLKGVAYSYFNDAEQFYLNQFYKDKENLIVFNSSELLSILIEIKIFECCDITYDLLKGKEVKTVRRRKNLEVLSFLHENLNYLIKDNNKESFNYNKQQSIKNLLNNNEAKELINMIQNNKKNRNYQ